MCNIESHAANWLFWIGIVPGIALLMVVVVVLSPAAAMSEFYGSLEDYDNSVMKTGLDFAATIYINAKESELINEAWKEYGFDVVVLKAKDTGEENIIKFKV